MISSIRKKMRSFLDYIQFKYIPCDVLVKDVYPLKIVPNYTMIRALAHQADPTLQVREKSSNCQVEMFCSYPRNNQNQSKRLGAFWNME